MNLLDLKALLAGFAAKMDKDEVRIRLFVAAVQNKTLQLVSTASPSVIPFAQESGALVAKWALKAKKLSFDDLFRDPYGSLREETRQFAAKWALDPVFVQAMG